MAETTKTYTEREVIERERAAWVAGMERGFNDGGGSPAYGSWPGYVNLGVTARLQYPMPKVERIRRIADPHWPSLKWSVVNGILHSQYHSTPSEPSTSHVAPTPGRVAVWADLFANPTELVEDDGSAAASPEGR